jgi:hypothetical protein
MINKSTFQRASLAFLFGVSSSSLSAALLAEESFLIGTDPSAGEYEDEGLIIGMNPTVMGFTGAWDGGVATAETGTLNYSDGSGSIQTAGGKIRMGGSDRAGRQFSQTFDSSTEGTYYLGFLYQQQTTLTGYRGFALYNGAVSSSGSSRPFTATADGSVSGQLNIENDFSGASGDSTATIDSDVNFFVFRFDMSTDDLSDSLSLYMNPDLATGPSASSLIYSDTSLNIAFDHIGLERWSGSGIDYNIYLDEIRVSQSYNEVSTVPVPEAKAFGLVLGLLGIALAGTRRRASRSA